MAARGKSGYPISIEKFAELQGIDPSQVAEYQVENGVPYFLWMQSLGLNPPGPEEHFYEDIQALLILLFLTTPKGKELYSLLEPMMKEVIHMNTTAMSNMFKASSAHPALALPGILLFTSINESLHLIDHGTAQKLFGLEGFLQTSKELLRLVGEGVTTINFGGDK